MKNITLLLTLFLYTSVTAQFRIVSSDAFEIDVPKNIKSYSIYCHSTSLGWQESYKGQRVLMKTVLVKNGYETKITEFDGNHLSRIQYNYFNKGLLVKAIVKNMNPASDEIFYYKYDIVSVDPTDVKGYKNGKLIYTESRIFKKDTQEIKKHYINVNYWVKAKERIVIYYSKDSLIKTEIEYRNNLPDTNFVIIKYNQLKKVVEKVDSSRSNYSRVVYKYDTLSRVINEKTGHDNELSNHSFFYDSNGRLMGETKSVSGKEVYLIKHDSLMRETITSEYYIRSNEKRNTANIIVKRFDTQGHLIFEETVMYLNEGIIGMPSKPFSTSIRYWMYENGRIVKYMYRKTDDGPIITYDVTYKD